MPIYLYDPTYYTYLTTRFLIRFRKRWFAPMFAVRSPPTPPIRTPNGCHGAPGATGPGGSLPCHPTWPGKSTSYLNDFPSCKLPFIICYNHLQSSIVDFLAGHAVRSVELGKQLKKFGEISSHSQVLAAQLGYLILRSDIGLFENRVPKIHYQWCYQCAKHSQKKTINIWPFFGMFVV